MRDGRIEKDDRSTALHHVTSPLAEPHLPSGVTGGEAPPSSPPTRAELLRMLTAHGKQMNEVLDGLSPQEKTELSQVLSDWAHLLPASSNGEDTRTPVSGNE